MNLKLIAIKEMWLWIKIIIFSRKKGNWKFFKDDMITYFHILLAKIEKTDNPDIVKIKGVLYKNDIGLCKQS